MWTCPKQVEVMNIENTAGGTNRLQPVMHVQQPAEMHLPPAQLWDWTRDEDLFTTAKEKIEDVFKVFPRYHRLSVIYTYVQDKLFYSGWNGGQDQWESVKDKLCICSWITVLYGVWNMDISDQGVANN